MSGSAYPAGAAPTPSVPAVGTWSLGSPALCETAPMADGQPVESLVKIGVAASALGVSIDTLRRWERAGRISFERRGRQRYLASEELARIVRERGTRGLSSARNHLAGTVIAVKRDGVMAQIDMVCGPYRIVSLMSREAADELGLVPGDQAIATVKATTVIVEKR
jgi:molybdopterin-binding protein